MEIEWERDAATVNAISAVRNSPAHTETSTKGIPLLCYQFTLTILEDIGQ